MSEFSVYAPSPLVYPIYLVSIWTNLCLCVLACVFVFLYLFCIKFLFCIEFCFVSSFNFEQRRNSHSCLCVLAESTTDSATRLDIEILPNQRNKYEKAKQAETSHHFYTYPIFVTGTTGGACGEQICHVETFFHMTNVMLRNSPHGRLACGKILHMRKVTKICNVENKMYTISSFLLHFTLFCYKICKTVISACKKMLPTQSKKKEANM